MYIDMEFNHFRRKEKKKKKKNAGTPVILM